MDIFSVSPNMHNSAGTLNILILLACNTDTVDINVNHKNMSLCKKKKKMYVENSIQYNSHKKSMTKFELSGYQ